MAELLSKTDSLEAGWLPGAQRKFYEQHLNTWQGTGFSQDNTRLSPTVPMAFSLVFLNMYEEGGAYTEKQYHDWLKEAGFTDISIIVGVTKSKITVNQPSPWPRLCRGSHSKTI